jgi:hypothetical protein
MEYLLLLLAIVPIVWAYRSINLAKKIVPKYKIQHSQSRTIKMIDKMFNYYVGNENKSEERQSIKFFDKQHIRVLVVENEAYWIANNTVYVAHFAEGVVDKDSAKEVDTTTMNDVELKKMIKIIDELTEGNKNEDRGKWNS